MRSAWSTLPIVVVSFVVLLVSETEAFYCGARVVSIGDPQVSVQRKCGDPDTTEWRISYRALPTQDPYSGELVTVYTPVAIEVWLYNFGPQRFMEELSFENGRLMSIQSLGYGSE